MEELGLDRPLDGEFAGLEGTSSRATYFDTSADLGFIVEIATMPEGYVRIEPDGTYP
jgi:hypothetical protein